MTNYFTLLKERQRPWIDVGVLNEKFRVLSAEVHPDRVHQASPPVKRAANRCYAELNAAHQCLCDRRTRTRHLLKLELGSNPGNVNTIPGDMTELFTQVGDLCREIDLFIAKKEQETSPMLQATMLEEGLALDSRISIMLSNLNKRIEKADHDLQSLNPAWENADGITVDRTSRLPLDQLQFIGETLGFLGKWRNQLRDRSTRLMF